MKPQFFFDTADANYIRKVWECLCPHVDPNACLGITTNPNALSKIDCTTLLKFENVILTLCVLTTEMRGGIDGGVVWVQTPNSKMPFNEIFDWASYILELTDGITNVGMKIPHWTAILELTDELSDMGVEINVTGISDWATLLKAFQYKGVSYASIIPGRMEEVGLDANLHMEYIDRIRRPQTYQKVIAGSMRTVEGLRNAIVRGTVPTIGNRVWDRFLGPTGRPDMSFFLNMWAEIEIEDRVGFIHPPIIDGNNVRLSEAFFEQMDLLGESLYKEFGAEN